jgi:hypothetical protein
MPVSTAYILHGIKTPTAFYSQVVGATPTPGVQAVLQFGSGWPQPLFKGIVGYKPTMAFRTTQVASAIAECGLLGVSHAGAAVDLYFRALTDFGTRDSAGADTAICLQMPNAFMYMKQLSASNRGLATCEIQLCGMYDGTNAPLNPLGAVAIAGTPSAAEYFGLGPVEINSSALDGVQELSLDIGPETFEAGSSSEPYDTFISMLKVNPKLMVRGLATEPWTDFGLTGTALTGLAAYLRKVNNQVTDGLAYVADATAGHILMAGSAGVVYVDSSQARPDGPATTGLVLDMQAPNATTNALLFTVGSAIT